MEFESISMKDASGVLKLTVLLFIKGNNEVEQKLAVSKYIQQFEVCLE